MLISGGLPIRQSKQLSKARHGAEARKAPKVDFSDIISEFVKRKARKMFYYSIFAILSSMPSILAYVSFLCSMFLSL